MAGKMLVVEDYPETAHLLQTALEKEGHQVTLADTAPLATRIFDRDHFDLVLLDINLREGTGYDVCRHIRNHASRDSTPVIMLTAKNSLDEKAEGFALGADNYLTKPIDIAELLLWVEALLRRKAGDWSESAVLRAGELRINPDTRTVHCGKELVRGLTTKEFHLLYELARATPKTLTREELRSRIWKDESLTNTIEVHVKNLRRKLGPQVSAHIVTVRGVGYRFE